LKIGQYLVKLRRTKNGAIFGPPWRPTDKLNQRLINVWHVFKQGVIHDVLMIGENVSMHVGGPIRVIGDGHLI